MWKTVWVIFNYLKYSSNFFNYTNFKSISSIISKFAAEKCIAMSVKARNGSIISIAITITLYVIAFRLRLFHLVIVAIAITSLRQN